MKYTTAKTILKIYRKEGRFGKKKQRLKKGYAKAGSESHSPPSEKLPSLASPAPNACARSDNSREDIVTVVPQRNIDTTLCTAFWSAKIAEHFS